MAGRLNRLENLKALMQTGEPVTVRQMAEELGVSVRTVWRDLEMLRDQGLPIEADRGRGGGVRLHRHWGIGRVSFSYAEAIDLLISLAIAEQMQSPIFMAGMNNIRRKLIASFAPEMKYKVSRVKSRIMIGPTVSNAVFASFIAPNQSVVEHLHQAFLLQRAVWIRYRSQDETISERIIQPHYLLLCYPVWYVLAWDELRGDIRTFRCDRIISIQERDQEFQLLPPGQFQQLLADVDIL